MMEIRPCANMPPLELDQKHLHRMGVFIQFGFHIGAGHQRVGEEFKIHIGGKENACKDYA